ncbi:MAG: tRNA (adenosine(37)-N6)-dimethylallyltransferase MiaA, partial [Defluviitaleaceae bacterium]|nr:tRNA (adenosine(37)-N6)-dimethylallyltransferase MiaA [Defluviitaleaceae bacterium]
NALLKDTDFSDDNEKDTEYREELSILAKTNGNEYVHNMLKEVDFGSYEKIHPNNIKRVIRALEFYKQTGQKISVHNLEEKSKKSPYDAEIFILDMDRAKLYERINERVDIMMKKGLIEEVENLLKMGYNETLTSMQGLGYKEIVPFLKGEWTKDFAIEILKRDTRRFAKRQLTWFRHQIDEGVLVDRNEQIQLFTR